jgi:hypothetical protein
LRPLVMTNAWFLEGGRSDLERKPASNREDKKGRLSRGLS